MRLPATLGPNLFGGVIWAGDESDKAFGELVGQLVLGRCRIDFGGLVK